MPNTGKPSPACHLCRSRRVKCDLSVPGCLRCSKVGKVCPGYRDLGDLLFHNQNKVSFATTGKNKRGCPKRLTASEDGSSPSTVCDGPDHSVPSLETLSLANYAHTLTQPSIPSMLVEDWHSHSVPMILHQLPGPTDGNRMYRFSDFLPDLYRETNEDSCLNLATDALAKAYFTNMSQSDCKMARHLYIYGKALRATTAALQDPVERVKDSTLIAVWLLGVHEVIVNSPSNCPPAITGQEAWHAHSQGLAYLLHVRGPHQFSTPKGRDLFWMMYIIIQTHCLTSNQECPPESLAWLECMESNLTEDEEIVFVVSSYNCKISALCSRLRDVYRSDNPADDSAIYQASILLSETDMFQSDMDTWVDLVQLQPADGRSLHIINTFRAALIKLQHFLVSLLDYIEGHPLVDPLDIHARRQKCIAATHCLSRTILESVPHGKATPQQTKLEHWSDGLRLLWPLIAVSWTTHGLRSHRDEAKLALRQIGMNMGIRLALNIEPPAGRFIDE